MKNKSEKQEYCHKKRKKENQKKLVRRNIWFRFLSESHKSLQCCFSNKSILCSRLNEVWLLKLSRIRHSVFFREGDNVTNIDTRSMKHRMNYRKRQHLLSLISKILIKWSRFLDMERSCVLSEQIVLYCFINDETKGKWL